MKKKLPISIFELVTYIICGLLGLWGLTYISLGIAVVFISTETDLAKANDSFGDFGFLGQGIVILLVAVLVAVIVLLVNAKKSDRDFEKAQRRAARLAKVENVVDVESTPAE